MVLFIWLIIFLIIWVLLFILSRIYFKKAFRILSIISIVLFFVILVIGVLLFLEAKEMKEKFPTSNNTFLFDLDGNIVAGTGTRRLGLVMASRDPVAIDAAAAKIAGVNPNSIEYIQLARKEGLGNTSLGHTKRQSESPREDRPSMSIPDRTCRALCVSSHRRRGLGPGPVFGRRLSTFGCHSS